MVPKISSLLPPLLGPLWSLRNRKNPSFIKTRVARERVEETPILAKRPPANTCGTKKARATRRKKMRDLYLSASFAIVLVRQGNVPHRPN